ncbi:MerR family transcriptional regulator [Sutcliffiella horikoshii]|uniref:MerR family transcriptional regulator n=1 Tax=Sutcliffiella horikoshii TaxID=79883 RepID=UPI00204146BE|nr:MerR family transcriptional regulator [Sutcliffiella horikoshii]MCM3617120.1 MerR family transcriptional regulator [Sutcliffiella horikoshii]
MELKTHEVAKELGMAPRTIRKWVQKYNIPCTKNDYGHYVYDAEAISLLETLKTNSEVAAAYDYDTVNPPSQKNPEKDVTIVQQRMDTLLERVTRTEQLVQQKADDVVSYQLLQQRKEIEELTKKVEKMEGIIDQLHEKQTKKLDPPLIFDQPSQPKRRNVFRSIFGL